MLHIPGTTRTMQRAVSIFTTSGDHLINLRLSLELIWVAGPIRPESALIEAKVLVHLIHPVGVRMGCRVALAAEVVCVCLVRNLQIGIIRRYGPYGW